MNNLECLQRNISVYVMKGNESTDDIIKLCEEMKQGKYYIEVNSTLYAFANLPEFLEVVNKICDINLDTIWDKFSNDLIKISKARIKYLGDVLDKYK